MPQGISDILSQALTGAKRPRQVPATTAGAPAAPLVATDGLALSTMSGPLQRLFAGQEPTPAEWVALTREVAAMGPAELAVLNARAKQLGWRIRPVDGGRLVTFQSKNLVVTADALTGQMRRTQHTTVQLFENARLKATMAAADGRITITQGRHVQVWDGQTGIGTENGRPLAFRAAAATPGEPPRVPWATTQPNRFHLPDQRGDDDSAAFVARVDDAVRRSGGRILKPADAGVPDTDWVNCYSYALTDGAGDLADPFARTSQPRWLQSPMFQLLLGGYGQLAATQRVKPGDIALYQHGTNVTHVGIVRAVDADGNPSAIESKFGAWGVYLHRPFDVHPAYGGPVAFFRRDGA